MWFSLLEGYVDDLAIFPVLLFPTFSYKIKIYNVIANLAPYYAESASQTRLLNSPFYE